MSGRVLIFFLVYYVSATNYQRSEPSKRIFATVYSVLSGKERKDYVSRRGAPEVLPKPPERYLCHISLRLTAINRTRLTSYVNR